MNKKITVFLSLTIFAIASIFAHGKSDIEELEVDNLNSWQESFDLEGKADKKAVKYNIVITATDRSGNKYVEGPHNLYIDPNSDLPICNITNPYPNMRVVGNLNIVGTCVDDDAVSYVELIFDDDIEHPVRAEGREFWSYYLDTLNLNEGLHTIKVTGYDVNGLPSKPVTMNWQLDRNQPVTEIQDKTMGVLVSGRVNFQGEVSDGNGIKELYYSLDNGRFFTPIKLGKAKDTSTMPFSLSIDTKQLPDGPAVLWFKAIDNSGSQGVYSFLYYIDNTKPDVEVIYPASDEYSNGMFTIAGYAKDTVGITELTWTFGGEAGEFELIPGNPYWAVNVNTIGAVKERSRKFTIHAVDKAGNVVDKSVNILLNQEDDKPLVEISDPSPAQIFNGDDQLLFVRGIARDDDNVKSVRIQLDDNEPIIQATRGVFYQELGKASDLSAGNHKITVVAVDENDIEGNPTVVQISSKGVPPQFENPSVVKGKESIPFENGDEIHPESNASFGVTVKSDSGIKAVHTEMHYGKGGVIENDVELKNVGSYNALFPFNSESPKGVITFVVKATDVIDRVSETRYYAYVTNTSVVKSNGAQIVFDDSTVSESGVIINNPAFPVTGYLIGAKLSAVELVPETDFAKVESSGNLIKLIPGNAICSSEPIVVTVTSDKGEIIESKPLTFKYDKVLPTLKIDNHSESNSLNGKSGYVSITGSVTCDTGVGGVSYRILGVEPELKAGVISSMKALPASDFVPVAVSEEGTFKVGIDTSRLGEGMFVAEVVAESAGGNKVSKGVAISNLPDLPEGTVPKAPVIAWVEGMDVYALGAYQGTVDRDFYVFPRKDMAEGSNPLAAYVVPDGGKEVASRYTAYKDPTLEANFALVDGRSYYSGMTVTLPYGLQKVPANYVSVYIDTGAVVSSVTYEITGDEVPGGDNVQKGTVKLEKPLPGDTRWIADIPLNNLPARVNHIAVTIKAGSLEKTISGSVTVVRNNEAYLIEDTEQIFTFADLDTVYDADNENWVLSNNSKYFLYANLPSPVTAELVCDAPGLLLASDVGKKFFTVYAEKDGLYSDVKIVFTDGNGTTHETPYMNFLADSEAPELNLQTPVLHQWLGDWIKVSGTAADSLGVRSVEYSTNNGASWTPFVIQGTSNESNIGVTFNEDVEISYLPDGLFGLDIRAIDNAGHISEVRTACFKDTKAPQATVILPQPDDVINGENLLVIKVEDEGYFNDVQYVIRPEGKEEDIRKSIDVGHVITCHVGGETMPFDDSLAFVFSDEAGNKNIMDTWFYKVDSESDLPRAEIHVPEELEVVTRDFTISGIIYDDDGDSRIWYKIDDGEYIQIPEPNTSFSIDVPIITMSDNEHTISVYAVDVNGVRGLETTRTFRVSLEEPKGEVIEPAIDVSVSGVVTLSGVASDKNGIAKVEVSLDNGNSFNDAEGGEDWSYTVDSRAIPGGTEVVFLRITDNYGIVGLYSSLINIDNDAPTITLDMPVDDSTTTGELFFAGSAFDNVEITRMYVTIRNMEDPSSDVVVRDLTVDYIIGEYLDITDLDNGYYNIQFTGEDMAGNKRNISRNVHLDKTLPPAQVDILYPMNGEHKNGRFNIYGQVASNQKSPIRSLRLFVDDVYVKDAELSNTGFFKIPISPTSQYDSGEYDIDGNPIKVTRADLTDGVHKIRVDAMLENGQQYSSREQQLTYKTYGPWVTLDNFAYGYFAINRPFLRGEAGYTLSEEEVFKLKAKDTKKEEKDMIDAKSVEKIEISLNNGKTYETLSTKENWAYRVENEDIPEGYHFMLVRATMKNGETAVERFVIQVDNTSPTVRLITPNRGGHYNQEMIVSGLSQDDVALQSVTVALRKGDKAGYELPSFVQGLYLDLRFFGPMLFDFGAGFTFFDDNVKLQIGWGMYTQDQRDAMSALRGVEPQAMRYGGNNIWNLKIIANVASIPFRSFLGRDWDWLSATFAIGAEFARFNQTSSGSPQFLSALLGQMEFPRVHLSELKYFSTFSFYTEGSLWFIPSDISSNHIAGAPTVPRIVPQIAIGIRANVF